MSLPKIITVSKNVAFPEFLHVAERLPFTEDVIISFYFAY